jgi:mono/diheme cytochrome c family protein
MKLVRTPKTVLLSASVGVLLLIALAGCASAPTATPRPTSTPIPRFEAVEPTEPPQIATSAAATDSAGDDADVAAVELNPTAVARGQGSWERLECASCHGEAGEGGAGELDGKESPALVDTELTEDEFIDWLRTGGTLGNDHLYSTDRLSDSGGRNLYQFVQSLSSVE